MSAFDPACQVMQTLDIMRNQAQATKRLEQAEWQRALERINYEVDNAMERRMSFFHVSAAGLADWQCKKLLAEFSGIPTISATLETSLPEGRPFFAFHVETTNRRRRSYT